ncbi:hypothetical protein KO506_11615 [Polaribacter vadi]|uniref:hypothetical protein n=1 Tax=Polaribacter TaxID=52959 RepID=UPI001C08B3B5|nr:MULTISPECIES: hypothetical protein [Polaribacter]MBU3012053.1 hypothetical protein [Polaribacter vadi]MDO6741868.1 hypothetical protein [Polaribacter sp. 1_MG-2023]
MKTYKVFVLSILSILLFSCSKDDEIETGFTSIDLQKIDGNSSKTWQVDSFYSNYNSNILSEYNDCYTDDTFTFYKDKNEAEANLGTVSCFFDNPTEQAATLTYSINELNGRVFLNVSRGESFNNDFRSRLTILELEELTENRMLFAAGDKGNYMQTLILTAIN